MTNSTRLGRARQGQVAAWQTPDYRPSGFNQHDLSCTSLKARRKFLRAFPGGFRDQDYLEWERNYKWRAHLEWQKALTPDLFEELIKRGEHRRIAKAAIAIKSRTNLLFLSKKLLFAKQFVQKPPRKNLRSDSTASCTAHNLWKGASKHGCKRSVACPAEDRSVLTWPAVTVFGFLARPGGHFFFKPTVTREAARRLGVDLPYAPKPSWPVYKTLLNFVKSVRAEIKTLDPRDMIDLQSFLWVQGSEEYPELIPLVFVFACFHALIELASFGRVSCSLSSSICRSIIVGSSWFGNRK